jgi:hypothetical protein
VLILLAVMAGALAALAAQSGRITAQTERMLARARAQDLQASGVAWARRHPPAAGEAATQPASLDAGALAIPGARLTVGPSPSDANLVRVACRCGTEGRTTSASDDFRVAGDR